MIKKANLKPVGSTKMDKIKVLLAKLPEPEMQTLLEEVKLSASKAPVAKTKPARTVGARKAEDAGYATEHNRIVPQDFFHQYGAVFWICGSEPLNLWVLR